MARERFIRLAAVECDDDDEAAGSAQAAAEARRKRLDEAAELRSRSGVLRTFCAAKLLTRTLRTLGTPTPTDAARGTVLPTLETAMLEKLFTVLVVRRPTARSGRALALHLVCDHAARAAAQDVSPDRESLTVGLFRTHFGGAATLSGPSQASSSPAPSPTNASAPTDGVGSTSGPGTPSAKAAAAASAHSGFPERTVFRAIKAVLRAEMGFGADPRTGPAEAVRSLAPATLAAVRQRMMRQLLAMLLATHKQGGHRSGLLGWALLLLDEATRLCREAKMVLDDSSVAQTPRHGGTRKAKAARNALADLASGSPTMSPRIRKSISDAGPASPRFSSGAASSGGGSSGGALGAVFAVVLATLQPLNRPLFLLACDVLHQLCAVSSAAAVDKALVSTDAVAKLVRAVSSRRDPFVRNTVLTLLQQMCSAASGGATRSRLQELALQMLPSQQRDPAMLLEILHLTYKHGSAAKKAGDTGDGAADSAAGAVTSPAAVPSPRRKKPVLRRMASAPAGGLANDSGMHWLVS